MLLRNQNNPIAVNETKVMIKILLAKKNLSTGLRTSEFYQTFKDGMFLKVLHKIWMKREFPCSFDKSVLITLIPKPNEHNGKRKLLANFLHELRQQEPIKFLQIQFNNITRVDTMVQGWFNIWKSISIIQRICWIKDKHCMVISIGTEKSFAIKYSLKIATKVFGTFTEHPSSVPRTHFGDFTIFGLTTAYNSSFRESNVF